MTTRGTPIVVEKAVRKSARGWVAAALTMALVAVALAGLISAWRFFPERLPPQLRANDGAQPDGHAAGSGTEGAAEARTVRRIRALARCAAGQEKGRSPNPGPA